MSPRQRLLRIYGLLRERFGHRNWWPGETDVEMVVGAILTQNTSWKNVEAALANLREADALSFEAILRLPEGELAALIRPSGYFNIKARRLKGFARWLDEEHGGDLERLFALPVEVMRAQLLGVYGVGPETADCIILYGARKASFVIDAYTRRAFARIGFTGEKASYDELQEFCTTHLPVDLDLYNDFHAQIVYLGKDYCKPRPRCGICPIAAECDLGRTTPEERP